MTEEEQSRRLPRGSHGIPADIVARNQRERLIAAMAEVCAERGYALANVSAVAKRARVSSLTFYKQFDGKEACMLAAHQQLSERLLEAIDRTADEDAPAERARAAIRTALALFAADPPSARLLTVEVLAAGDEGRRLHDVLIESLAERLGCSWVGAAGMLALVGKLAATEEAEQLPALEDELVAELAPSSKRNLS